MSTCAQCGAPLEENAAFCGECGAKQGKAGTVPGSPITGAMRQVEAAAPAPTAAFAPTDAFASTAPALAMAAAPVAAAPAPVPAAAPAPAPIAPAAGPVAGAPRVRGALAAGTVIDGKYAISRVLGEGGMGVVYLARDIHTGGEVVLKSVRRELAHRSDVRQRTLDEGRVLAQIDHPNVVQLKAVVVEAQDLWLVMQYIDGESLDRTIAGYAQRGERMPAFEALGLMRQIAAGVGAAHQEGVVHRDLKPANVLLRKKDRTAKVTDFGIAKIPSGEPRPQTKGIIGSLWYMSPEQVTGRRDLDPRVDIYALGIVLYQMLTGHVPFDDESDYEIMRQHAEAPMPRVSAVRPDVPAAVDELIQKACAKDRAQRFQTCEEMCAAIDRITTPAPPARTMPDLEAEAAAARALSSRPPPGGAHVAPATTSATAIGHPAPPPSRSWLYAGAGAIVAGGAVAAVLLGAIPGIGPVRHGSKPAASHERRPAAGPSSAPAVKPKSPLEALAGAWVANGKDLDATLVGDELEFRVRTPAQFEPQNYEAGEARFTLHASPEAGVFSVEDRIRPLPPLGKAYDPRARNTCQEVWSAAGGEPLEARFDGARLTVELAKIEPEERNFLIEGGRVIGCKALSDLKAARVVNTLSRP